MLAGGFIVGNTRRTVLTLLGLSPFKRRRNCSTRVRSRAAGWELAGRLVPLVDPRRLLPPQHAGDDLRDPLGARGRGPQQAGDDLPHLRHRHGRGFPPRPATAPGSGTTAPRATTSCGGASPPSSAPRTAPARLPPPPRRRPPRSGAARTAPGPVRTAAPRGRRYSASNGSAAEP